MTAALMIQGTGSDVGKSLIVAGLARAFTARGLTVRPFKPQNMSNNAAVTVDGGEIGRAQALQARACNTPPTIHMNPVLLKPESETGAQVIVHGKRQTSMKAGDWVHQRMAYMPSVLESFNHLGDAADLILVEGAGSPAETNLRKGDIANMGFAHAANVPVVLVGDIHRGGVIASIVGTFEVISSEDSGRIAAFLVNNFHGDTKLFDAGRRTLETRTGVPCAGVIPHFTDATKLPAEDALALDHAKTRTGGAIKIAVPRLSRIANFDDLDPLAQNPDVSLTIVQPGHPIPNDSDLILLPGTKSTIADLAFLRDQGWDIDILSAVRQGKRVLGLCGGYQMLGRMIHDPDGLEGSPESVKGLGLLNIETKLSGDKTLANVTARHIASGEKITGYEIHLGQTEGADCARPFAEISGGKDGAISADGLVTGTYLHGIFSADKFRTAWLKELGGSAAQDYSYNAMIDATLDALGAHMEAHIDLDLLLDIAKSSNNAPPSSEATR